MYLHYQTTFQGFNFKDNNQVREKKNYNLLPAVEVGETMTKIEDVGRQMQGQPHI